MNFKAVIFDLDGTLLDTLEDIANSMNSVLKKHGFPVHGLEAFRYFVGDGVEMLVRRAIPADSLDEEKVGIYVKEFLDTYAGCGNATTKPYEGLEETLDGLTERGIRMAILSNKPQASTAQCVVDFLKDWKFDIVLGQREGVPRKPDPASAFQIATFLRLDPEHILFLGDTGVDMKTATSAGMYPVGALWGFRSGAELKRAGAKSLIKHPKELLRIIRNP